MLFYNFLYLNIFLMQIFYFVYFMILNNNKYGIDVNIKNMYLILLKFKYKNKMEYIFLCKQLDLEDCNIIFVVNVVQI